VRFRRAPAAGLARGLDPGARAPSDLYFPARGGPAPRPARCLAPRAPRRAPRAASRPAPTPAPRRAPVVVAAREDPMTRLHWTALPALAVACAALAACASAGGSRLVGPVVPGIATPAATPAQRGAVPGVAGRRIVGYFNGPGVLRGVNVAELRGDRLTHLIYAFADIGPDGLARLDNPCVDVGQCAPGQRNPYPDGGVFQQLRELKRRYPHLQVLVSFGGWTRSTHFSDAAATPAARKAFIDSAVELMLRRYPGVFDGFDLDWEFPVRGGLATNSYRPEDRANFSALVRELRQRLDDEGAAARKHYLLTIASPAGPGHMGNQDLAGMAPWIDFYNVMCYNYHGAQMTYFNAPLFASAGDPAPRNNVDWTVRAYLELGIPAYKIVVGVPFYAVSYAGVPPARDGLFQLVRRDSVRAAAAGGAAEASGAGVAPARLPAAQRPWGVGGFRYHLLAEARQRGFRRFWQPDAHVPWLYHPGTGVFIGYDDPRSLAHKGDYVRRQDLGGIMIWEIGSDATGELLQAVWQALR